MNTSATSNERVGDEQLTALTPHQVGSYELKNRIIFGPHRTNLCHDRALGEASLAYYGARISSDVAMVVTEDLSVDPSDWPYEYAPEIQRSLPTLALLARLGYQHGTAVVASLNHSGAEGSSAYSQRVLLAPSDEVDVDAMEPPKSMEPHEIDLLKRAFRTAASNAVDAGASGVEINVSQRSLLRQFLSTLTNHRVDSYGTDRALLLRETIGEIRHAVGNGSILGVRLCVDERASWGGITLETAAALLNDVGALLDYVVVTSGSGFTKYLYRPDFHQPAGFNADRARDLHDRSQGRSWALAVQGSITNIGMGEQLLNEESCELVEMTRALICDPDLIPKLRTTQSPRPCIRCNQGCLPQDTRNISVRCLINPDSGWELSTASDGETTRNELGLPNHSLRPHRRSRRELGVHIVGAGICGLDLAIRLHEQGLDSVHLYDSQDEPGGTLRALAANRFAGNFNELLAYYLDLLTHVDVNIEQRFIRDLSDCNSIRDGDVVAYCVGAQPIPPEVLNGTCNSSVWIDTASIYSSPEIAYNKTVVLIDEMGSTESIATSEILLNSGASLHIVTSDPVFGTRSASTGDLVPSLQRLRARDCTVHTASRFVLSTSDQHEGRPSGFVSPVFGHQKKYVTFDHLAEVGRRQSRPTPSNEALLNVHTFRLGDALAPRSISEALLEAERCATTIYEMLRLS
ncbi:MAG: NAD(P)-binding protein [Acidimicrobiales bacterium]